MTNNWSKFGINAVTIHTVRHYNSIFDCFGSLLASMAGINMNNILSNFVMIIKRNFELFLNLDRDFLQVYILFTCLESR